MGRHLEVHHQDVIQRIETIGALVGSSATVRSSSSYLPTKRRRCAASVHMLDIDYGVFCIQIFRKHLDCNFRHSQGTSFSRLCIPSRLPFPHVNILLNAEYTRLTMHMMFRTRAYVDDPMPLRSCTKIFHGCDRELDKILDVVCTDSPTRVAVLGPGGIGGCQCPTSYFSVNAHF